MAVGIIEKGSNGLFNSEIEFTGKYSLMAKYLKDQIGLFPTYREIYVVSVALGLYLNKKDSGDLGEKVQPSSIFPSELTKKKADLKFIYRIMMLVQDNPSYSIEDYMNRAFRDDTESEENREMVKENMKLFNSFACGGLEYLYRIFENQDDTEKVVDSLYEFVHGIIVDQGLTDEPELPDFIVEINEGNHIIEN